MFLSIVGAEAGHMALRSLATGGVYVCGGIPPRVSLVVGRGGDQLVPCCWPPTHSCPPAHSPTPTRP